MLQIIVLNGDLQGTNLNLFEGFKISNQEDSDLKISDSFFDKDRFFISCDSSGNFTLSSEKKSPVIAVGEDLVQNLDLMPGLIFSIGDIGFSVQESDDQEASNGNRGSKKLSSLFEDLGKLDSISKPVGVLKQNLTFKFVRGFWINQTWSIPYQPISFGKSTTLLFFLDDLIPSDLDFLHITQSADSDELLLTSDLSNFISINGELINSPKEVSHGDLIEFAQTAFYIEVK